MPVQPDLDERDPAELQQEVMQSFRDFESSFRRRYPAAWWLTLVLPPVVTSAILAAIGVSAGLDTLRTVVIAALVTFFGLGRFAIPLVDQIEWLNLSAEEVFLMVSYLDLMVAMIIPFHIGLLFRIPGVGPKFSALVADGQFILRRNPWMKRASILGLVLFVMFPLAATGSVGGAIFSRLLGMSRLASISGIMIGSLLGNGVMYLFAAQFRALGTDNPLIKYGGIVTIAVIIIVLERRYRSAKKRFMAAQKGSKPD